MRIAALSPWGDCGPSFLVVAERLDVLFAVLDNNFLRFEEAIVVYFFILE
jgi:hypothetical protein